MNNKKVQAQMQIDVSFIGNTTKLVKELQSSFKSLDLSSNLTKQFEVGVSKGFKDLLSNLDKMSEGLSKKGLSTKQYTNFFDTMNTKIQESTKFLGGLKDKLTDIYSSEENKKAIKDLENYKKKLEEINKLASAQKASTTRRSTAIKKMEDETGVQYGISKRMLANVNARKQNKQDLTANQKEWMSLNGLDEKKLARVLELYKQITAQRNKIESQNEAAKKLTGQSTVSSSSDFLAKQIGKTESNVLSTESYKQAITQLSNFEGKITQLTNSTDSFGVKFNDEVMPRAQQEAEKLAKASGTINEILAQFGIAFTAATVVRGFQDLTKSAFDFYKSLDSALNEIYIVSNLTSESVNGLKSNFISMAKETGMALDDITRSATLFYQQGLNTNDVMIMTEVTSEFAKVAGIDATDAADKLTAAVNGYCLAAEDAAEVADKFNKVAAASAADINELSTAFSKAAAQANQAGVSMDNYLAYIATMEEATREAPENIGTSLKTIFSRMQQVKEAGTSEDGETDINAVETALKSVGIALRDTKGELRDLEDVFAELGPKWQSLDRNTQAYLGTIIAGTRQQSRFVTLMQNWDRVLDLADQSANSAGQQALMHAKAMDSIKSKLQQFQVAWQEFVSNLASSDVFKGLITTFTKLLEVFSGGNQPIILLSAAIGLLSTKLKDLQQPIVQRVKDLKGLFTNIKKGLSTQTFATKEDKESALATNKTQQEGTEAAIAQQTQKLGELNIAMQAAKTEEEQKKIADQRKQIEADIVKLKKQQTQLADEEKDISAAQVGKWANFKNKAGKIGQISKAAGMGLQMAGAAVGATDSNAGGVLGSMGSVATAVGQFATGNWVGGLVTAATSIYQITETIDNWDDNIKARIEESVSSIGDALGNVNNLGTGIKSTQELLNKYDTLNRKLYKTQEEQEQLNTIVQQLGDTYGIDVLTDAYGNLSINIGQVNEKLEKQKAEQLEAIDALSKKEQEAMKKATSGLGNDTTMAEFLDQMFSANAADYRTILSGLEDGLTSETRNVSQNVAEAFSSNLKSAITDKVRYNGREYIYSGFAEGIKGIEDSLNKEVNSQTWNELYSRIDFLEKNIKDMTFSEAQDYLQDFYDKWGQNNDAIKENWDIIVDSINNTVFQNQSLLNFFKEVDELQKKGTDSYWENDEGTGKLDKLSNQLEEAYNKYNSVVSGINKADHDRVGVASGPTFEKFKKEIEEGYKTNYGSGWKDIFRKSEGDDAGDKLDNAAEVYREAIEEREKLYEKYAKDHGLDDAEEAKQYIEALGVLKGALKETNEETLTYMGSLEQLYNTEGMSGDETTQYAESIKQALEGIELMGSSASDADRYNYLAKYYEANKEAMKDGAKEQWEEMLNEAFAELEISTPRTLTEIGKELDSISSDLIKMNDIMADFNESGGMTLDTFMDLADIIDGIDLDSLGDLDPSAIQDYIDAIHNLNLAYDENNGYITMNGDSLKSLQDIQELQTKSKLAGMIADLKASRATTETQIAYIDAQIAATDAAIEAASISAGQTVDADTIKSKADSEYNRVFNDLMTGPNGIATTYENDVSNQGKWSTAVLKNIGTVADAWSKYFTGVKNKSISDLASIKDEANDILSGEKIVWEGMDTSSGIDWNKYPTITGGSKEQTELLGKLNSYKERLENSKKSYQATLDLTNQEISLLENMYNSDLSKLGRAGKEKSKQLEKYIGKLKEIYNILNRIQLLEHRLSTLDSYSEVATGERYGQLLSERVDYNEQLLDQYEFLTKEQKQFTNGYKDFIQSVDGLQGVFDFDKFGQIIINWDKYNSLQDEAIDGETTLKEKADDVYETYTSMYEDLHGYFDNTIKYYKAAIDLQQEMIDQYMTLQDKAASAIKEIYQKILNTRLEAIDQEKDALEELREAREKARKDQENAKTISGLQTNIQRAMMDTSGASDTAFIKAQQDMNDKLEEIADDKYSEELDNIINRLDEEKDALQEQFDELFDNQAWLYDNLDKNFMMNYDELEKLFTQTEEWNQASPLRQKQLVDEWSTAYHTYADRLQGGDKTIYNIWENIQSTKERIGTLDENLKSYISKGSIEIANTIAGWQSNASGSGGSGGKDNGGSGGSPKYKGTPNGGDKIDPAVPELKKTNDSSTTNNYTFGIGDKVKSNVGALMDGYAYDKKGNLKKPVTNKGLTTNKLWTSGETMFVTRRDTYNGTNYYGLAFSKGGTPILWANGHQLKYKNGGFADFTGPAWMDGTPSKPEAVLNALQTEHFIKFTDTLDKMFAGGATANNTSSVSIDTISFNVESMSSAEDGEKAFNVFVDKFKEIGSQSGIKIDSFKNRL